MSVPTRYPSGISTNTSIQTLGDFGLPDPTKWITKFDDFLTYNATEWSIGIVGTGATRGLVPGNGGLLVVSNGTADNDKTYFQAVAPAFVLARGFKTFFKAAVGLNDVSKSDLVMGLQAIGTTPLQPTPGIYFQNVDRTTKLSFMVRKDAVDPGLVIQTVTTIPSNAWIVLGFEYDGASTVKCFVGDKLMGSVALLESSLPTVPLALSFGVGNGEAVKKSMAVDYVFTSMSRGGPVSEPTVLVRRHEGKEDEPEDKTEPAAGGEKLAVKEEQKPVYVPTPKPAAPVRR